MWHCGFELLAERLKKQSASKELWKPQTNVYKDTSTTIPRVVNVTGETNELFRGFEVYQLLRSFP